MILEACAEARPSMCPLYESTADKVHARVNKIFENLKRRSLPVSAKVNGTLQQYGLVDYSVAKDTVFMLLYAPYGKNDRYPAEIVMRALAEAEKGNGLPLAQLGGILLAPVKCDCPVPGKPAPPIILTPDAQRAIACGDAEVLTDTEEDLEQQKEQAKLMLSPCVTPQDYEEYVR